MKKIILGSFLVMLVFFIGLVLFTPVETGAEAGKTTLWKSLVEK